jgi:hypothetical protein
MLLCFFFLEHAGELRIIILRRIDGLEPLQQHHILRLCFGYFISAIIDGLEHNMLLCFGYFISALISEPG